MIKSVRYGRNGVRHMGEMGFVPARPRDDGAELLVRERVRLAVRARGGDVRRARPSRHVVAESARVAPVLDSAATMRGDVARRLDDPAHRSEALHQVTHGACGREVGNVVRTHKAPLARTSQLGRPDAKPRESVAVGGRGEPTDDARCSHELTRRVLRDAERNVLLGGDPFVRSDLDNVREHAAATATSGRDLLLHWPSAL